MPTEISLDLVFALVLAAAAGWFAAHYLRRPQAPGKQISTRPFSEQYFEGLNYLLNEQPDRALEVLLRMSELDSDTVETHLALGSLYRRRGEVDRAIRVHESVMSRQSLRPELREQAMYALAEDYLRAGLFDRAETLFQQLTERPGQRTAALRNLLRIYEQQSDCHLRTPGESGIAEQSDGDRPLLLRARRAGARQRRCGGSAPSLASRTRCAT